MRKPGYYIHLISHAKLVVSIWNIGVLLFGPVVAFMTFMEAITHDIPLAYVITSTVLSFAGSVWLINQLAMLFGRPVIIKGVEDYSYGLGYNGVGIAFDPNNESSSLQIVVFLSNACRQPLRYKVERFDVVVGDRAITEKKYANEGGVLPLVGTRQYRYPSFKKETIKDLIGKRAEGSIEIHIIYGGTEGEFVRRMKMKIGITISLQGVPAGIADVIHEEIDEPFF